MTAALVSEGTLDTLSRSGTSAAGASRPQDDTRLAIPTTLIKQFKTATREGCMFGTAT
jgi:hypothetical protein